MFFLFYHFDFLSKDSDLQSPFTYIDRAVIFLGEREGWQMFLQTTLHAASNMLLFSSGKFDSIVFPTFYFILFIYLFVYS